jgi:hypothetical protein
VRSVCVLALAGLFVAGCGGGGGKSAGSSVSAAAAKTCFQKAGFQVREDPHDSSIGETAQIGVTTAGNTVTVAFMQDSDAANQYWKIVGGAENKGAEPGGNDQIGSTVVQWFKRDAALTKIESCVRG